MDTINYRPISRTGIGFRFTTEDKGLDERTPYDIEMYNDVVRRINNWEDVFKSIIARFIENYDLYRGTGNIANRLNTKNAIFDPVVKSSVDEIISYLKTNPRSITINMPGYKEIQDIINEIVGKLMHDNNIYNKILKAFTDYLIYGISLFKIESDSDLVIDIKNIDIKNCMWDLNCSYDDFKPSFFICEYIENNATAANKYGYKATEKRPNLLSLERLNITRDSLLEQVKTIVNDSETMSVYYGDDVFNKAKKVASKKRVSDGLSQILEYYVLENIRDEDDETKITKYYTRYVFVNQILVEESLIPYDAFPYVSMAKYVHDADRACDLFESKIQDMKAEIIHINTIENSIIDSIACHANGTLMIKKSALMDKDKKMSELKSDVLLLDEASGAKLSDVIVNLPPATVSPVMIDLIAQIQGKIKSKFGLINFDPTATQSKSGYHESLRLDRESQSISHMVSPIDNVLNKFGNIFFEFIKEYSKKSLDVVSSLSNDENASEILDSFARLKDFKLKIDVSESRESPNNTMRLYNQLKMVSDISGQPLNIPYNIIADMLNVSDSAKELINQMNSVGEDPMQEAEIRDKTASAMSKEADAIKKTAEAQNISKVSG